MAGGLGDHTSFCWPAGWIVVDLFGLQCYTLLRAAAFALNDRPPAMATRYANRVVCLTPARHTDLLVHWANAQKPRSNHQPCTLSVDEVYAEPIDEHSSHLALLSRCQRALVE